MERVPAPRGGARSIAPSRRSAARRASIDAFVRAVAQDEGEAVQLALAVM